MKSKPNVRAEAARLLSWVLPSKANPIGRSASELMTEAEANVPVNDRSLFKNLCFGTLRWYSQLDEVVKSKLQKSLKNKDQDIYCLLLLGAYQLKYLNVPDHAAISETVNAVINLRKPWAKGLVNGVLRQIQRQGMEWEFNSDASRYSHPQWIIDKLREDWPDHWQNILEQNNQQAPLTLRVNSLKIDPQTQLALFEEHNIKARLTTFSPFGLTLEQAMDVQQIPGFPEGNVSVQDEGPQLLTTLIDLPDKGKNQRILDACAAPGGKTCHLLEQLPEATLHALDVSDKRLQKLQENCDRLQLHPTIICDDLLEPEEWWDKQAYDVIVLDAPCSATGVIRRHPDIKWVRQEQDVEQLSKLQYSMLKTLWPLLKPGGTFIYCTCSIFKMENRDSIVKFLSQQEDAISITIDAHWGVDEKVGRQLLPQAGEHDGFFYAKLQKNANAQ